LSYDSDSQLARRCLIDARLCDRTCLEKQINDSKLVTWKIREE
jgi:hypothetical protein